MASRRVRLIVASLVCAFAPPALMPGHGHARELRICASHDALAAGPGSAREARGDRSVDACDATIVPRVNAPPSFAMAAPSRSAYVVIYRPRRLRQLVAAGDVQLRPLRFGVALVDDATTTRHPIHGLARHGIFAGDAGLAVLGAHAPSLSRRGAGATASVSR